MDYKRKTLILAVIALLLTLLYIFYDLSGNISYILPRRVIKVIAILLTGGAIAFATTVFMTITNNRILTPSVMGLDSLYLLTQTVIIFIFGSGTLAMMNSSINYLLSIGVMIIFSLLFYQLLFKGEGNNIYFLLLIGMILGTFFSSLTSFMQVLIDPNEFMIAQDRMFASINNVNTDLVYLSVIITIVVVLYFTRLYKYLDVLVGKRSCNESRGTLSLRCETTAYFSRDSYLGCYCTSWTDYIFRVTRRQYRLSVFKNVSTFLSHFRFSIYQYNCFSWWSINRRKDIRVSDDT